MRVILTDNFGMSGEAPGKDETELARFTDPEMARNVAGEWNAKNGGEGASWYARVVEDSYKLQKFEV